MKFPVLTRKEKEKLKVEGGKVKTEHLEIRYLYTGEDFPPRMVIQSLKSCGKAVRRNLLRRIIREWLRERYPYLPSGLLLFIRAVSSPSLPWREWRGPIRRELEEAFGKIEGKKK